MDELARLYECETCTDWFTKKELNLVEVNEWYAEEWVKKQHQVCDRCARNRIRTLNVTIR